MNKKLIFLCICIVLIGLNIKSIVALDVGENNQQGVIITRPTTPTNSTGFNTNSSDFWDNLNDPSDFLLSMFDGANWIDTDLDLRWFDLLQIDEMWANTGYFTTGYFSDIYVDDWSNFTGGNILNDTINDLISQNHTSQIWNRSGTQIFPNNINDFLGLGVFPIKKLHLFGDSGSLVRLSALGIGSFDFDIIAGEKFTIGHDGAFDFILDNVGNVEITRNITVDKLHVGTGTPSHPIDSSGESYFSGRTEFDGVSQFDGDVYFYAGGNIWYGNNVDFRNPAQNSFTFKRDTIGAVTLRTRYGTDQMIWAVNKEVGNQTIYTSYNFRLKDFDHITQSNPTWYFQSGTDPDIDNTQWGSITHNQSNYVLESGNGNIYLKNTGLISDKNITSENVFLPAYLSAHTNSTIPVAIVGVWYNITFDEEEDLIKERVTHNFNDNTNITFTIVDNGIYEISYVLTFEDSNPTPTSHIISRVVKNGLELNGFTREDDATRQNTDFSIEHIDIISLSAGDTIQLQFTSDATTVTLTSHLTFGEHKNTGHINIKKLYRKPG